MTTPALTLAFLSMPGGWEWIVILILGLLFFGRKLPEVGRAFGKTIVEFKKGMASIDEEVHAASPRSGGAGGVSSASSGNLPPAQPQGADHRVSTADRTEA